MPTARSTTTVKVRFTREGFHCWPDAPERRAYLRERHRHLFHVSVQVGVTHADRDIEFHDLLDDAKDLFPGGEMGSRSCEIMAAELLSNLRERYGNTPLSVSVFEDGEVGAIVSYQP